MASDGNQRRSGLVTAALELLETDGPEAVSTRKIAARYGASTMVVYSEFGSLAGLVSAVVERGFELLRSDLLAVAETDDPVADILRIGAAYRRFAIARPDLYRVIYAMTGLVGHHQTGTELLQGAQAFDVFHSAVRRAYRAGRLHQGRAYDGAAQLWTALHGAVAAEISGFTAAMPPTSTDLVDLMARNLMVGLGDTPEAVDRSLAAAAS